MRLPKLEFELVSHRWTLTVDREAVRAALQAAGVEATRIVAFEQSEPDGPLSRVQLTSGQEAAWARFIEDTDRAMSAGQLLHGFSTALVTVVGVAEDGLSWIEQRLPASTSSERLQSQPVMKD